MVISCLLGLNVASHCSCKSCREAALKHPGFKHKNVLAINLVHKRLYIQWIFLCHILDIKMDIMVKVKVKKCLVLNYDQDAASFRTK